MHPEDRRNPWLARRGLNIAHQGGSLEAPANTTYAFDRALAAGADMLEIDVHATVDGHLVVLHDATVDATTDGHGPVDAMTLDQLRQLDAAHWFVPGSGAVRGAPRAGYPWRGVAAGLRPPPPDFTPEDFTVPTLERVLSQFPDTPVSIDIKRTAPDTAAYEQRLAELLRAFDRTDDVLVASFQDKALAAFHAHAPDVRTGMGPDAARAFWTSAQDGPGTGDPRYLALQVPVTFEGVAVVSESFVTKAHANGLAVHVWTINDPETMRWLLDVGVDGIVTDRPTLLAQVLRRPPRD